MNLIECRYGGWDGKKWLSDVYVLDTSNFFAQAWGCYYLYISFFFFLVTQPMSNLFYMPSASSNSIAGVDAAPSYWISATT